MGRLRGKYGYLTCLVLTRSPPLEPPKTRIQISPQSFEERDNFGIVLEATYPLSAQLYRGKRKIEDLEFDLEMTEEIFGILNAVSDPMSKEVAIFVLGRPSGANSRVSHLH
jgi:hypothetical protein